MCWIKPLHNWGIESDAWKLVVNSYAIYTDMNKSNNTKIEKFLPGRKFITIYLSSSKAQKKPRQ